VGCEPRGEGSEQGSLGEGKAARGKPESSIVGGGDPAGP